MSKLEKLAFYSTHSHPCSYLTDQQAITVFADPHAQIDRLTYSQLSELGFRRSGDHIYRPHCKSCQACIPARVLVNQFKPGRQQRRTIKHNQDLQVKVIDHIDNDECFRLYVDYIEQKHQDGDMYPPDRKQYADFLKGFMNMTSYYGFYKQEQLLAVAITDQLDNALSAIYTFYDPNENKRSLGVNAILWQIQKAQSLQIPYLYLGYWIKQCRKMSYKTQYRPLELFIKNRWCQLN